ncbi:MAG: polysaccharide deacetylase family protein [Lachnospiraceae bacterium]|nr:polysaccharide deacetylase family protein [Lachnospiraceae bacterium]
MNRLFVMMLALIMGLSAVPGFAAADSTATADSPDNIEVIASAPENGWVKTDTDTFYYVDGVKLKGFQEIEGETYYFGSSTGKMYKGFTKVGGSKYYFGKTTGKMYRGVHKIGRNVYTFNDQGVLVRTVYGSKKAVALTYDDGPSDNTATILDALEKNGGLATFFVVGNRLGSYPKSAARAVEMGCQIANHSWSHPYYEKLSDSEIKSQISKTNAKIKEISGHSCQVARTPGGSNAQRIKSAVNMPIILWSIDTLDWKTRNADSTYNTVMNKVKDGDIILMHDLYKATASASVRFIPKLVAEGYQLVTVQELALLKGVKLQNGVVYTSMR